MRVAMDQEVAVRAPAEPVPPLQEPWAPAVASGDEGYWTRKPP